MVNENLPYLYYAPGYDYGQSPYNPYNPYIPGATIGTDGSILVPQLFYALPSYENSVSSLAYVPVVNQSGPDALGNGIESYVVNPLSVNHVGDLVSRYNFPSNTSFIQESSNQRSVLGEVSDDGKANSGSNKQHVSNVSRSSPNQASMQTIQVGGNQVKDGAIGKVPSGVSHLKSSIYKAGGNQGKDGAIGKVPSGVSQLKNSILSVNGLSHLELSNHSHGAVHEAQQKICDGRVTDDEKFCSDKTKGQNLGTSKKKSRKHLVVKAYTSKAGHPDSQGNITIYRDQYNRVDFPVDYANAMFFVIKSYSEDDVHKSIKYNVWSSTPNGNKKLNTAYEDAQRLAGGDPRGCPIFLFFSVNASGQFCGVAEMIGPVNFDQDMDFWQQDKWSGSFPVKWHIIKDLPNPNFRHILLENNENKPVTFSRDTQEISYRKGLEMLQKFKNYASRTSLLDDFMYYENRQRILQEVRCKKNENPYLVPPLHSSSDENVEEHGARNLSIENKDQVAAESNVDSSSIRISQSSILSKVQKMVDKLAIGALPIDEKRESVPPLPVTATSSATTQGEPAAVLTTGTTPVNVADNRSSSIVTIGTIPLDLKNLHRD